MSTPDDQEGPPFIDYQAAIVANDGTVQRKPLIPTWLVVIIAALVIVLVLVILYVAYLIWALRGLA